MVKPPPTRRIGFHVDVKHLTSHDADTHGTVDHYLDDGHHGADIAHDDDNDNADAPPEENPNRHRRANAEQEEILNSDRLEREERRTRAKHDRLEQRAERLTQRGLRRRRRTVARPGSVDARDQRSDLDPTALHLANRFCQPPGRDHDQSELPAAAHLDESRGVADVATYPHHVRRFAEGPAHGTALAIYFALLPYVVLTKWGQSAHETNTSLVRLLLVVLAIFWLTFIFQLARNVVRIRHGALLGRDGSAWLAGLVVVVMPFLLPSDAGASAINAASTQSVTYVAVPAETHWTLPSDVTSSDSANHRRHERSLPVSLLPTGALSMALVVKRRKDSMRQHQYVPSEEDIDETIAMLRADDPQLIATLRHHISDQLDGVVHVSSTAPAFIGPDTAGPVIGCVIGQDVDETIISFAREGGQLFVPDLWTSTNVIAGIVALHEGGCAVFANNEQELLWALATRVLHSTVVVYVGASHALDARLRGCCVTLSTSNSDQTSVVDVLSRHDIDIAGPPRDTSFGLRAELLRSDPRIVGITKPFTATLRRRCVEMVSYLALHRNEPVTGDRLRSRVLTHADVDASMRTLANTASAVRRSLGADALGPHLHAVTSSGLYVTHELTSDVEIFHGLVGRARLLKTIDATPLLREALNLVQGEPLASALRGFEWFLAEGHAARLARDGEWAALALHHESLASGDYELAYWALEKGRLIDPYSDALIAALARVPRLREFGGDRSGRAQHDAIGPSGAEAMGRTLNRLSNQIA